MVSDPLLSHCTQSWVALFLRQPSEPPIGLQYSPVQEGNQSENKKRVEVIDLTIESSSDEEDLPPTKKHCPVTSAAIPALPGSKGYEKRLLLYRRGQMSELPFGHRASYGMGKGRDDGTLGSHVWLVSPALSPHYRALTSGHQPSSVLRSPAMGTLGSDFLSSLPLHEYPPAFPLGADIQGRTLTLRWRGGSCPRTLSRPVSLQSPRDRGNFFFFSCGEGVRRGLILIFLFLPGLDLFSFLQTESQVSGHV